eukprot:TRINITY_DN4863_c0_g1_i10.p3 TRINITY_DN4863_c0_g1~~TRINITY_DN4863_c0_g1_i10.p3  ORF type:complete len:107 (-),score=26.25 TRINITY_DN4863_c0_g1_i10:380-700(-)
MTNASLTEEIRKREQHILQLKLSKMDNTILCQQAPTQHTQTTPKKIATPPLELMHPKTIRYVNTLASLQSQGVESTHNLPTIRGRRLFASATDPLANSAARDTTNM